MLLLMVHENALSLSLGLTDATLAILLMDPVMSIVHNIVYNWD